jgi:hypothetical protein
MLISLEKSVVGISAFYVGHISSDFAWYCAVGIALVLGKQILSGRIYTGLIIVCGIFLAYLGVYFFYSGIRKFLQRQPVGIQEPSGE